MYIRIRLRCVFSFPRHLVSIFLFFFNDTATTEIYTLSLHDALPICQLFAGLKPNEMLETDPGGTDTERSEEHTSELQSPKDLVCRLLLEKKKHQDEYKRQVLTHSDSDSSSDILTDCHSSSSLLFFFNDTATTEIYTLSLHDALPIYRGSPNPCCRPQPARPWRNRVRARSEEHTSELQSPKDLVCRLLLEKKKKK